jgi:L-tyrosine isonitrile synthase
MLSHEVLKILKPHLRVAENFCKCEFHNLNDCFHIHLNKLAQLTEKGLPISFVLPAFPAKSPNNNKTMGYLPDLGEYLALQFLNDLCEKIRNIYTPGAKIIICSDGRVFNDLVKVSDSEVNAYNQAIQQIISTEGMTNITTFGLDDYYGNMSYEAMREKLINGHGDLLSVIKSQIKEHDSEKNLFNGIHRFIFEDHLTLMESISKNKLRELTKETAYQVIQRSHAWGAFVQKTFPSAVRLSIHPQCCGSEKLGIMLLKSKDRWATPWHRVVLFDGKEHILVRKKEAEEMGGFPIFKQQQFSHYVLR